MSVVSADVSTPDDMIRLLALITANRHIKKNSSEFNYHLVPETGLEPARLATYAPKAYVYTNFTTRACKFSKIYYITVELNLLAK